MSCRSFRESESDCTSENGAGQFNIFGAVEEKADTAFSPSTAMKRRMSNMHLLCNTTAVFVKTGAHRKNLAACAAGFSTMRTQEMQKDRG